jgi:bifunctional DNA-binding transcriptional regulator/antitoxin component of YhaV-PrlF toxin-antitoxin module
MPNRHVAMPPPGHDLPVSIKAAVCRSWLGVEALVDRHLGRTLSAKAYRIFLVELYLADLEHTSVFQSYFAAGEAPANAHRRSAKLARLGALTREPDTNDHRRTVLRLVPKIRQAMDRLVSGVVTVHQAFDKELHPTVNPDETVLDRPPNRQASGHAYAFESDGLTIHKGKLLAGGRLALPLELRRALGLHNGDTVLLTVQNDEIRIRSARSALRRIRERLHIFAPKEERASAQLIADRRSEVLHG